MRTMRWPLLALATLLLAGCGSDDTSGDDDDDDTHVVTGYDVLTTTDPATVSTGAQTEVWYTVVDQDGLPIENLQQSHERIVHVFQISSDLTWFRHTHHEDYYEITSEALKTATFHQPITFPYSGDFLISYDFAHQNLEHIVSEWIPVDGDVPQLEAPVEDLSTTRSVPGIQAELRWDVPPIAGFPAEWTVILKDDQGQDITDIVQYLGADAHVAIVLEDLSYVAHTHAWFPGMENMPVTHTMPHEYDGPELPFHYTLPYAGTYKIWVQFARADAPEEPYAVDFMFKVTP